MIYPKIKKKNKSIKFWLINLFIDIKNILFKILKMIVSLDYFILFMKKNFHF